MTPIVIFSMLQCKKTDLQEKGGIKMTKNEKELIEIFRENDNSEQAVLTAIKVFSAFLEQLEAAPVLQVDVLQESF